MSNHSIRRLGAHLTALAMLSATFAVPAAEESTGDKELESVVVTGTLIPQAKVETTVPVTTITAADMQARGFASVADALQQSTFATGSVQGPQFSNGFTPGAQTLSLFGLSPSYVKYLIDGRPMSDYPALYNGTDVITSITGIPIELVDHIDVLPGGQSSIYGSDAIAGVINVILKKKLDALVIDARLGGYRSGGGTDRLVSIADGFEWGRVNLLAGLQYEKIDPIWGYQRRLTDRYFDQGTSPQTAERDVLVYGLFGTAAGTYYLLDPSNCAALAGQFGGTLYQYNRPGRGDYCGTTSAGYYTIGNGVESLQGYLHGSFDLTDRIQFYGDALIDHEVTKYNAGGTLWWGTTANYGYFYDPNFDDFMNVQRIFSPEEGGGLSANMNKNTTNAFRGTVGAKGWLGGSRWSWDVAFSHTEQRLEELTHVLWNDAVEAYFANLLGPSQGTDPYVDFYPVLTPDYAAFYQPISVSDYRSFSGDAASRSKTFDNMLRAQLTTTALFALPGGDAGLALVAEAGNQGWRYDPDPRFLNGGTWGYTATAGGGHRSRYAFTGELRLPVLSRLTGTVAGRYDAYKVSGETVDKATYTLGLEFRPIETVLLRGRYGTAFKAPTLSDEYQGMSGYYVQATDYYLCEQDGYTGSNIGDCQYYDNFLFGTTSGSTGLKPINAKVWDLGLVWSPGRLRANVDFMHWDIDDEVTQQNIDQLLKTEMQCRDGTLDANSPSCQAAFAQVERDGGTGLILSVATPKVNVSKEIVSAVTVAVHYDWDVGQLGTLGLSASWNDMLKHSYQQYAGDPFIDLLADPTWSTDFKTKTDASLTWTKGGWRGTVYAIRYGRTPNYIATQSGYEAPGASTLGPWTLVNVSAGYKFTPNLEVAVTVDNLSDRLPPIDHSYPGTSNVPLNIFAYNNYGRSYYLEVNYKFRR